MDYTEQYSQWLSAYLDGELESAFEEPLFSALASHADLRREMRELLALRRAARHDHAVLVPPVASTKAIFQSLGIGVGAGIGTNILQNSWFPLLSALGGGVITWLAMTFLFTSPPPSLRMNEPHDAVSVRTAPPETTVVERIVYRTVPSERTLSTATVATTNVSKPSQTDVHQSLNTVPMFDEAQSHRSTQTPYLVRRTERTHTITDAITEETPELPPLPSYENYPQFRLLIRGLGTTSLITVPQQPDRSSVLSTSAVGLFYTLSDHHAVGIEIGREPFAMKFYGYQEDTRLRFEAYPALLWGVLSYQYRTNIGSSWEPFAQFGIGATEFGLLGRATAGIMFRPAPSVGVMLGVESALMRYVYQSRPYLTPNVGITYGVLFRF